MSMQAPHQVAVLVLPGVLPLDLGIPVQAFGGDPRYQLTVCAETADEPVACGGFTVTAPAGLGALREADTVVVPGYQEAPSVPPTAPVLAAIRARPRPRRAAGVDLLRRVRAGGGGHPRRAPGHHPLAGKRAAAARLTRACACSPTGSTSTTATSSPRPA